MQKSTKFGGVILTGMAVLTMACSSRDKNYDSGSAYPSGTTAIEGGNAMPAAAAAAVPAVPAVPAEPLPPLTPAEIGPTINYTVKTGDSLWLIAKNHQSSIGRLKRINQLTGDNIRAGQTLKIPSKEGAAIKSAPAAVPAAKAAPAPATPAPAAGGFRRPSAAATPPASPAPKSGGSTLKIQD